MTRFVLGLALLAAMVVGSAFPREAAAHGPHGYAPSSRHYGHHHGHHHHYQHFRPSYGAGYGVGYGAGYYVPYSAYPGYYYARPQPRVGVYFGF
jgi:hypothetical protein